MWNPSEEETSSVQHLSPADRYNYFIKKAADQEAVWSLWSNGWALASDGTGRKVVPVWPHAVYADLCANDEWQGYLPKQIELNVFLERWLPGIKRDERLIAVFPTRNEKVAGIEADSLARDLEEELQKY